MGQSKLTLQVLSAYLPYGVKVYDTIYQMSRPLIGHSVQRFMTLGIFPESEKLLLRPLSDLTTEIEHNGERFVPIENLIKADNKVIVSNYVSDGSKAITITITYKLMGDTFTDFIINRNTVDNTDYRYVQQLLEWHFDLFSLLDSGDALPLTDKLIELNSNKS